MDFLLSIMQVTGQKTQREAFCRENFKFYPAKDKVVFEERIIYYLHIAFVSMDGIAWFPFLGSTLRTFVALVKKQYSCLFKLFKRLND